MADASRQEGTPSREGGPRAHTGIVGLDAVLGGGLPARRLYLIQGDPGTGKTTLALQFLLEGVRRSEASVYVTLSETQEELTEVADSHGWDLSQIVMHELSSAAQRLAAQEQNTLFYPAEVELNETVERVMKAVAAAHPRRIVFDSLSEMRLLAGDALSYRRQILLLKQRLAPYGCTALFLDDKTNDDGIDLQLQSLAHGVLELARDRGEFGGVRRQLEVVKMRGVEYCSGMHDFSIERGGIRVFPRLVAAAHGRAFNHEVLPSGCESLDALQNGGLVRGTTTVLVGPSGSGKSNVAATCMQAVLRQGKATAVFNFDENDKTFFARAKHAGIELQSLADTGLLRVQQIDPAEMGPGEFVNRVRQEVEEHAAQLVVIDSLNGYLNAMPAKQYLILHMHEMLTYLNQMGCTTLVIVAQHGLLGNMETPIDVTYLADSVMLFRFFEAAGRVRKALSVVKKRIGGHEDTIRELQITGDGIRLGPPLKAFQGVLTGSPSFVGAQGALLSDEPDAG